jgi:hypothetical protein
VSQLFSLQVPVDNNILWKTDNSAYRIIKAYTFTTMAEQDGQVDSGFPSFEIDLFPTGDEGSGFHTQNDPLAPWQRTRVIQRKGAIDIKCSSIYVVHGKWAPNDDAYGTLLVLQFRFDPRRKARRIASADISLEFSSMERGRSRPEVYAISQDGSFRLVETTQHEEVTKGGDLKLGATGVPFLQAEGGAKWEKTTSADVTDATKVVGSTDLIGVNYGEEANFASWTLMENATRKTGVPALMRVGVLLKRKTKEQFKCRVEIKAQADFKSQLERVFGSTPKDDPVLFNPEIKPTNKLMKYDTENLGAFDLESVSKVAFATLKNDGIEEK